MRAPHWGVSSDKASDLIDRYAPQFRLCVMLPASILRPGEIGSIAVGDARNIPAGPEGAVGGQDYQNQREDDQAKRHWTFPHKADPIVKLHRAGKVVLQQWAEDEADQKWRQWVIGELEDRRDHAEAHKQQQLCCVVLPNVGPHQCEEEDERDQVVAWHRENFRDVGDQRQVQDQQHQIAQIH